MFSSEHFEFQKKFPFKSRTNEISFVRQQYPDRIPIICEKSKSISKSYPDLDKSKYLVPYDLTVGQFIYVIRKRMKLDPAKTIFLCNKGKILKVSDCISCLYEELKDEDGFLYLNYIGENVFG